MKYVLVTGGVGEWARQGCHGQQHRRRPKVVRPPHYVHQDRYVPPPPPPLSINVRALSAYWGALSLGDLTMVAWNPRSILA
ncbi:hypothetical protein PR202_ga10497 [Eleusine coracana subsp. coracana]|uniref:Uncharacterized protein n=1 Tax=Eleusine coracana subsp. coracana TaxID=191504 RepID=A0AAV5C700_ELECO|nr:hypothetical protein PR202_ga10497 [Eleusine coracana subsp. coracana]